MHRIVLVIVRPLAGSVEGTAGLTNGRSLELFIADICDVVSNLLC